MGLFGRLLTQTAVIRPFLRSANGDDIFGGQEERPCRLQRNRDLNPVYKNPSGEIDEVVANATMYCEGDPIPARSQVSIDGESFTVVDCYQARGFGAHHLEVRLQ